VADTYDLGWLQNWANQQKYTTSADMSWKVLSQVLPNFPNHSVDMRPLDDGNYQIILTGTQIDSTPVIVSASSK